MIIKPISKEDSRDGSTTHRMSYVVGTGVVWRRVGPLVGVRGSQPPLCGRTPRENNFVVANFKCPSGEMNLHELHT